VARVAREAAGARRLRCAREAIEAGRRLRRRGLQASSLRCRCDSIDLTWSRLLTGAFGMIRTFAGRPILSVFVLLAAATSGLAGCRSASPAGEGAAVAEHAVPIIREISGSDPAFDEQQFRIIRTQAELEALESEELSDAKVFWDRGQAVLLATLGEQSTGGYAISIRSAQLIDGELYVQGTVRIPGEDEIVTQAVTYPYAAALIPAVDAEVIRPEMDTVRGG
jgi:hypothetical protein